MTHILNGKEIAQKLRDSLKSEIIELTGKSNLDLPSNLFNSITVIKPRISFL